MNVTRRPNKKIILSALSSQIPLAMRLTLKYRINSERIEVKMERAGQTEILSKESLPFGGVSYFLFQAAPTKITVHLHNISMSI